MSSTLSKGTLAWPPVFRGRRYAVVGLGRNGLAAAATLALLGAEVAVWDDKEATRAAAPAPLHDPARGLSGFDGLVLSPGIPHRLPAPHPAALAAQAAGIPVMSDAELLFQAVRASGSAARFVGITGTNGKSTTTALLHHVLVRAGVPAVAGGNLGTAALALPLLGDDGVYVLEMSSYMLERLQTLTFDVAALLNISPDHLDRHGDMEGYALAKRRVFDRQGAGDTAVLGLDDTATQSVIGQLRGPRLVTVSGERRADIWCEAGMLRDCGGALLPMIEAPTLPGPHNAQNAAATMAMARALGLADDAIVAGLASYPGLPHRQQRVALIDGVSWINDSKATNADAAAKAIACYERIVWIAGGTAKAGGIEPLRPLFPRIAHALLIGRDAPVLAETLRAAGVPHTVTVTLEAAVETARILARQIDSGVVLLAPACASWDQFTGFDARGDRFRELVLTAPRHGAPAVPDGPDPLRRTG